LGLWGEGDRDEMDVQDESNLNLHAAPDREAAMPKSGLRLRPSEAPRIKRRRLHFEPASRTYEFKYRELFQSAREQILSSYEGVLLLDAATGCIEDANQYLCELLGYAQASLVGQQIWEVSAFRELAAERDAFHLLPKDKPLDRANLNLLTSTGEPLLVEYVRHGYTSDGKKIVQYNFRDLTSHKAHEVEIERLNRLYAAMSHINHAIVRLPEKGNLVTRVCRVLVEQGGFRMAWIGFHDPESNLIEPVAQWGDTSGYLRGIQIYAEDKPEGRGPTGTAFRTGRPYICEDMMSDPATLPWRAQIELHGFRTGAVFPLRENGRVCGVMTVYANELGFFKDKEIELLAEAAADVSFGLDNLARETARREAERTLRRERDFSEAVLGSLPGVLYLYDRNGRFLRWSKNFEQVTGYSSAEIANMHPLDFFAGEEKDLVGRKIEEVFERGEATVEASFVSRDGTSKPYFFTGNVTWMDEKLCLVGVGIDVTERKRAEELLRASEARYHTLFECAPDGIVIANPEGDYLDGNSSICRMLGYKREEFIGHHSADIVVPEEIEHIAAALEEIKTNNEYHREWRFRRVDGSVFPAEVIATQLPDANILGMIRDITERKRSEEALRTLNQTLELEVAARTSDLQAALVRAEAADHFKSAFLASMSHELRTPLNSIIGFTGIILQGLAGPLTPEQSKQLGMVRGSARHLLELINDVLDLSKIEAGQLEVREEAFDARESLERVTASIRPLAGAKGLALTARIAPELGEIISDRRRVEQILLNLLSNAVKFTDRGEVRLRAEITGDHGSRALRFTVSDTGIGIKPEEMETLFQPFRQLDAGLARQSLGTGLGLSISRRLALLLGGEIFATSVWGKGSEFTFKLPLPAKIP